MTGERWTPHADPAVRCITATHERIAAFARTHVKLCGRGVVRIDFSGPLSEDAMLRTPMAYYDLRSVRTWMADLTAGGREDADALIRLLETYRPDEQAVVMATATGRMPVMVRIRLDMPVMVDAPQRPQ